MFTRPNVVFVLSDQLRAASLPLYGETQIRTPNIDRLASEGVTFTNCIGDQKKVVDGLLALACDEGVDARVRRDAARALGELGRVEAAGEMLLALACDKGVNAIVRRIAAWPLG